jgi:Spy/CpxP family protein refolding chaperone
MSVLQRGTAAARLVLFVALACVAAADAMAQFGGGGLGGGMGGGGRRGGGSRDQQQQQQQRQDKPAATPETGANMLEQTIEELRIDLKLQPTQVPAWETYVGKARLLASDIARERSQTTVSLQANALKAIDRSVDAARNRLTALEDVGDAAKAFYGLLTPEQQAVADPRLAALMPARGDTYQAQVPRSGGQSRPPGAGN